MADQDALREQIMAALRAAKPVTRASALEIAMGILAVDETAARQFEKWFQKNGEAVVEMING